MSSSDNKLIEINSGGDVIRACQQGKKMAFDAGFKDSDQIRFTTAISELTQNALRYGEGGICEISFHRGRFETVIQACICDHGPGIPDLDLALRDGFSTGDSLGLGLPGVKRLVDKFKIESQPGKTEVEIVIFTKSRLITTDL